MTADSENTPAENTLLTIAEALGEAGAPRTDTERDGVGLNLELGFVARIRWLAGERDDKEAEREKEAREANRWSGEARELRARLEKADAELAAAGAPMGELLTDQGAEYIRRELDQLRRMYDSASADLDRARREHQEAIGEAAARELKLTEERDAGLAREARDADIIAKLTAQRDNVTADRDAAWRQCEKLRVEHKKLSDTLSNDVEFFKREAETRSAKLRDAASKTEDLSARYNRAADALQACTEERDKARAEARAAADDAAALATENALQERTIARLTVKIKRLESAGSGARFALTSEPRAAILKADIVVDAKSGKVVKNKLGPWSEPTKATRKRESYASANAANKAARAKTRRS